MGGATSPSEEEEAGRWWCGETRRDAWEEEGPGRFGAAPMDGADGALGMGGLHELNVVTSSNAALGLTEAGTPRSAKRKREEGSSGGKKKGRGGGSNMASPAATPTSRGRRDEPFSEPEENGADALERRPRTTVDVAVAELRETLRALPVCLASRDPSALLDGLACIFSERDLAPIAPDAELGAPEPLDIGHSPALGALRRVIVDPTAQGRVEVPDEKAVLKLEVGRGRGPPIPPLAAARRPVLTEAPAPGPTQNHIRVSDDPFQMPSHLLDILGRGAPAAAGVVGSAVADAQLDIARCKLCSRVMLASRFRKHQAVCPMAKANAAVAANPYIILNNPYGLPPHVLAAAADAAAASEPKKKGSKSKKAKLGALAADPGAPMFPEVYLGAAGEAPAGGAACGRGIFNAPPPAAAAQLGEAAAAAAGDAPMPDGAVCPAADGTSARKRKKTTLVSQLNKGPAPAIGGDNDYDLDHSCSVVFTSGVKLGMRCTHSLLTCKLHTTEQKKKVVGRSLPYDQLIKKLIAERKAAHDAGARVRNPSNANSNRYAPLRVPKPMAGAYATSRACNSFFRRRSELKEVFRSIFSSSRTYNNQPAAAGLAKGKPKKPKKADVLLLQQAQQHPQQAQHPQFMGVPLS